MVLQKHSLADPNSNHSYNPSYSVTQENFWINCPKVKWVSFDSAMHVQRWSQWTTTELFLLSLSQNKSLGVANRNSSDYITYGTGVHWREADHPGECSIKALARYIKMDTSKSMEEINYSIATPVYLSSTTGCRALVQTLYLTYSLGLCFKW